MPSLTRRGLLLGAAASIALTACREKAATPRTPTLDERARAAAATAEQALLDEYGAVLAAHADLTSRLEPLLDHHRRHVAVLVHPASPSATPTPFTGVTTPPALALRYLAGREQRLAATHTAALGTVSPALALLLASLAASAAANAAELGRPA